MSQSESIRKLFNSIFWGGTSVLIIFLACCAAPPPVPTAGDTAGSAPERLKVEKSKEENFRQKIKDAENLDSLGKPDEAFRIYMDLLANGTTRTDLVRRIISVVKKMNPPPSIPNELKKQLVFAKTASENARDNAGYDRAIEEYRKAARLAPWVADIYLNLSLVHEKRKNYEEAAEGLALFLELSPNDPQRQLVQDKIYEMEFMAREEIRRRKEAVQKRQACLDACGNITQPDVGIVRDQQHCVEIFGSFGHGLTPKRHRKQVECQNLVRNNQACKARC